MKRKASRCLAILLWLLTPLILTAQSLSPSWLDPDVRNVMYSHDRYFRGFATAFLQKNERVEDAIMRATQSAMGEMTERIHVTVSTNKLSITINEQDARQDETIRSAFTSAIYAESQAEIVGSRVETYYDHRKREAYALAYVNKTDLALWYRKQIDVCLGKAEQMLSITLDLIAQKEKGKASRQCRMAVTEWGKATFAQGLLISIVPDVDYMVLQQNRSEDLYRRLFQLMADLENSIPVYIDCDNGIVSDMLPGLLTDLGGVFTFVDNASEAEYVITVTALIARENYAEANMVFCYARGTVSVLNNNTLKTQRPTINEAKAGSITYRAASQKAFENLTGNIAEQILRVIR